MIRHYLQRNGHTRLKAKERYGDLSDGDWSALPYTCVLDWLEDQGAVAERMGLYSAVRDYGIIGAGLCVSRETVRATLYMALAKIGAVDSVVADFLNLAYEWSHDAGIELT